MAQHASSVSVESPVKWTVRKKRLIFLFGLTLSVFFILAAAAPVQAFKFLKGSKNEKKITELLNEHDKRYEESIRNSIRELSEEKDPERRRQAAKSLGYHGSTVVINALAKALVEDEDASVRSAAASALWKEYKNAEPAKDALLYALKDVNPGVRVKASWALQNMDFDPKKLVTARRSVLSSRNSSVSNRFWAAYGLIDFNEPNELIHDLLNYTKAYIRSESAEKALKRLVKKQDKSVLPPMIDMVSEKHKGNAIILDAMEEFKPKPEGIVNLICDQFSFYDIELEREALTLLRKHTREEKEVKIWLPKAIFYIQHADDTARSFSISVVGAAGGLAHEAVPALVQVMEKDPEERIRESAARAVGDIGDKIKPYSDSVKDRVAELVSPQLIRMIKEEPERGTRMSAVRSLDKLKTDPKKVIPVFTAAAVNDEDPLVQLAAIQALGARGADAKSAINDLEKLLSHSERSTRQSAKDALKMIREGDVRLSTPLLANKKTDVKAQKKAMATLRTKDASFDERGFMLALGKNDVEQVRAYLDSGVSANHRFESLHLRPALNRVFDQAAIYILKGKKTPQKMKDTAKLLLKRGADPNLTDKMGNTALMAAASACDGDVLQMLLDSGADLNKKSKMGLTALDLIFMYPNPGGEVLIKAGARLPREKVDPYIKAYGKKPGAVKLIKKAAGIE